MPLDPLTIVFAVVAIVVIWKLRSVLGERTGAEKPPPRDAFSGRPPAEPSQPTPPSPGGFASRNVVRLPGAAPMPQEGDRWKGVTTPGVSTADGLDAIAAADPTFSAGPFLDGARTAYEAIITAYAAAERKTLQNLLARDVYDGFATAIGDREAKGDRLTTTFVSIDEATIEAAALEGHTARVSVRFRSKQITATYGSGGELKDGSPDRVVDMNDVWTFAREVTSRDPNWKLVATQAGH